MSDLAFIAIDWGTTNRRAYAICSDGGVIATLRDDKGVLRVAREDFAGEVAALRAQLGDVPVLCAGMVGSTRGWAEVPYAPIPAGIDALVAGLIWVEPGRTAIVPGVATQYGRSDVMRGEEVQLLGAVVAKMSPTDAVLCQPGTHCKWARIKAGKIADFRTAMTGEIFALLRSHSLLSDFLNGDVGDGPAFREGLGQAAENCLLSDLFAERAAVVLGQRDARDVAARVSGLLIGSDVREQALLPGDTVHILADPMIGKLYAAAVAAFGAEALLIDSEAAFLAGAIAIWDMINEG